MVRTASLALLAALLAAAPASSATKTTCTKVKGDTVFRDRTVRLIQTVKQSKSDPDASTVALRFCKPGSKSAPRNLFGWANSADGDISLQRVAHAGDRLALELFESAGAGEGSSVRVFELSSRRMKFTYSTEEPNFDWYLSTGGGFAALERGKVSVVDGGGPRVMAATGASQLAGSGDTVYWTEAGVAKVTQLSGAAVNQ
jgi:hypothetical protein